MHKKYIDKIIKSSDTHKMEELEDVLLEAISYIEDTNKKAYEQIECDLYEIAEGKVIDKEKAIEWVNNMKPKGYWDYDDAEKIKNQYQIDMPSTATYILLNMMYSDFGDVIGEEMNEETIDKYIRAVEDWYYDSDLKVSGDEKLYLYYKYFVK